MLGEEFLGFSNVSGYLRVLLGKRVKRTRTRYCHKHIYAEAGIVEYWVVSLKTAEVTVFRDLQNRQYTTELTITRAC